MSEIKSKSSLSSLKNDFESEKIFTSGSKDLEKFKLYCSKPEKTERTVKKEKYANVNTTIEKAEIIETILNLVLEKRYLNAKKLEAFNLFILKDFHHF